VVAKKGWELRNMLAGNTGQQQKISQRQILCICLTLPSFNTTSSIGDLTAKQINNETREKEYVSRYISFSNSHKYS
jgi:hypothetical protein